MMKAPAGTLTSAPGRAFDGQSKLVVPEVPEVPEVPALPPPAPDAPPLADAPLEPPLPSSALEPALHPTHEATSTDHFAI
jgi:hypothetical protein